MTHHVFHLQSVGDAGGTLRHPGRKQHLPVDRHRPQCRRGGRRSVPVALPAWPAALLHLPRHSIHQRHEPDAGGGRRGAQQAHHAGLLPGRGLARGTVDRTQGHGTGLFGRLNMEWSQLFALYKQR